MSHPIFEEILKELEEFQILLDSAKLGATQFNSIELEPPDLNTTRKWGHIIIDRLFDDLLERSNRLSNKVSFWEET